jgi:hypothetical protein
MTENKQSYSSFKNGEVYDDKINNVRYWIMWYNPEIEEVACLKKTGKKGKINQHREQKISFGLKNLTFIGKCENWAGACREYRK